MNAIIIESDAIAEGIVSNKIHTYKTRAGKDLNEKLLDLEKKLSSYNVTAVISRECKRIIGTVEIELIDEDLKYDIYIKLANALKFNNPIQYSPNVQNSTVVTLSHRTADDVVAEAINTLDAGVYLDAIYINHIAEAIRIANYKYRREPTRDYFASAVDYYVHLGKPNVSEIKKELDKKGINKDRCLKAEIEDLAAVERTFKRIKEIKGSTSENILIELYSTANKLTVRDKVKKISKETQVFERKIYQWASLARRIFEEERGLRRSEKINEILGGIRYENI